MAISMNIKEKDYYKRLNVHKTATKHEIRSAYKILARQYHPDMNKSPGAEEKFKEIGAAYEVLSDDEKRTLYDQYGQGAVEGRYEDSTANQPEVSPFDLFDSIFSGSSGAFNVFGEIGGTSFKSQFHEARKGDDVRLKLSLSLKEAVLGVAKDIEISCLETCRICKGSGAKFGNSKTCQDCGGKCHVRKTQRTPFGIISQVSTCSRCRGDGKVITDPCPRCGGHGRVRSKKTINVDIPPGVISGNTIRVNGCGHSGRKGGPSGDLYVFLDVQDMQGIVRDDVNLYSNITISYTDAILGTGLQVETVEGFKTLEIPAGTQPGDVLVINNMGVPNLGKPSKRVVRNTNLLKDWRISMVPTVPSQTFAKMEMILLEKNKRKIQVQKAKFRHKEIVKISHFGIQLGQWDRETNSVASVYKQWCHRRFLLLEVLTHLLLTVPFLLYRISACCLSVLPV